MSAPNPLKANNAPKTTFMKATYAEKVKAPP